jgi:alpha-tubulin suppressor-like RCC1 family protein
MTRWVQRAAIVMAAWTTVAMAACGSSQDTGLMLIIDADGEVRSRAVTLDVQIRGEKGGDLNELEPVVYGAGESIGWPRGLAVVPKGGDASRTLRVHIRAFELGAADAFIEAQVIAGFERGQRLQIEVYLEARCIDVSCGAEETCFEGECVDAREAWQVEPWKPDAGTQPDDHRWSAVAAGDAHTCALRDDGTLFCWGLRGSGRLGDGESTGSRAYPAVVHASAETGGTNWTDWVAVAAGASHTCALRGDGSLWCWGAGGSGQRGDGSTATARTTPTAVLRSGEAAGGAIWTDWIAVAAGASHTCGLRAGGTLWCWGSATDGRLGNGDPTTSRTTPVQVLASAESEDLPWTDWIKITAGGSHSCGLREDGSLFCWGAGQNGRRGDASVTAARTTPARVRASTESGEGPWSDWTAVSGGGSHTCGRRAGSHVWCWGLGSWGQRGDDALEADRTTPAQTVADGGEGAWDDWTVFSAGGQHTCGLRADESLWCWGAGDQGQRGDGSTDAQRETPARVLAEAMEGGAWSDWSSVASGHQHSCGIRTDGTLWCWGARTSGRLGDGETDGYTATPVLVPID